MDPEPASSRNTVTTAALQVGDVFESRRRTLRELAPPAAAPAADADAGGNTSLPPQHLLWLGHALATEAPWHGEIARTLRYGAITFERAVDTDESLSLRISCVDIRAAGDERHAAFESILLDRAGEAVMSLSEIVALVVTSEKPGPASIAPPLLDDDTAYRLASMLALMRERGVDESARRAHIVAQTGFDDVRGAEVLAQFESGYSAGRRSALGVPAAPDAADSDAPLHTIARQMGVRAVEAMVAEDREQKLKRQRRTRFTAAMICAAAVVLVVLLLTF